MVGVPTRSVAPSRRWPSYEPRCRMWIGLSWTCYRPGHPPGVVTASLVIPLGTVILGGQPPFPGGRVNSSSRVVSRRRNADSTAAICSGLAGSANTVLMKRVRSAR